MRNSGLDAVGVKTGIVAPPPTTVVPVDCGMLCCCRRNNLEMPVKKASNYLGTGTGIVFVLLGRRTSDGKPGVSGRGTRHELLSWYPLAIIVTQSSIVPKRIHMLSYNISQPTQRSKNESVLNRQTYTKGYRCRTPRDLTIGVDGRICSRNVKTV